jgi:hypothetical protein
LPGTLSHYSRRRGVLIDPRHKAKGDNRGRGFRLVSFLGLSRESKGDTLT